MGGRGFFYWRLTSIILMKNPRIHSGLIWFVLISACTRLTAQIATPPPTAAPAQVGASEAGASNDGPKIEFDNKKYEFGTAWAGEMVKHVYLVTNTGTATLEITRVKPSCGCTTAGVNALRIEPGKTASIPVQFDDSRYSGNVTKTIDVFSNARNEPRATLSLRGSVRKPIDISPPQAIMTVQPDSTNTATTSVRIINHTDSPVTVSDPTTSNKAFHGELKTIRPGQEYELIVTAQPPFANANNSAAFSLKTTLTNLPSLNVNVIAAVQQAVQVSPGQVILNPSGNRWTTNRVLIRGNGDVALALEEPQSSDSRLQVRIVPVGPRNMFNLLVIAPPDFELPPGQHAQVTVKSNHPHYPLLTVAVSQRPRIMGAAGQYRVPPLVKQTATNGAPPPHP
jgi:hypothetical protein